MQQSNTQKLIVLFGILGSVVGCSRDQQSIRRVGSTAPVPGGPQLVRDLEAVDNYLTTWDRFAQGENQLVPFLRQNRATFDSSLTRLLQAKDKRAAARMVFSAVVQVGGAISADSELGRACAGLLGPDFPVTTTKEGERVYFAGDLYFWWLDNQGRFEAYPLFEEWGKRDFAKTVVVPMYVSSTKRK
jgi:hypothetical protein